jgi:hypothetical protein
MPQGASVRSGHVPGLTYDKLLELLLSAIYLRGAARRGAVCASLRCSYVCASFDALCTALYYRPNN